MRVLHIAQSIKGGPASYLEEIADFQSSRLGQENVAFLVPVGGRDQLPSIHPSQVIEFASTSRNVYGLARFGLSAARVISSFRPNVLHLHSTFAGAVARPIVRLFPYRTAVVYCAHGWSFLMDVSPRKKIVYANLERFLSRWTDQIINISDSELQGAIESRLPAHKMVTILNGIQEKLTCEVSVDRQSFSPEKINLVFVGRHDRQKGLDLLLDAMHKTDPIRVHLDVVGGPVVDGMFTPPEVDRENVTFHGWLSRSEVNRMIARSDGLIMPSRWEGFGLVALEAMRLAKPVLASRRGALPEIVKHGTTGLLFNLDSSKELISVLSSLEKSELGRMGEAGRERFRAYFGAERMNDAILLVYKAACQRAGIR